MEVLIVAEKYKDKLIKIIEPMFNNTERLNLLLEDKAKAEQKLKAIAEKNEIFIDSSVLKVADVLLDGSISYEVTVLIDGCSFKGEGKTIGNAVEHAVTPSLPFMRQRSKMVQESVKALLA